MFLLSPQYWLFEVLVLFLSSLVIFWLLSKTKAGRRFLGIVFQWNDPDSVAADAAEVKSRAKRALPSAAAELEHRRGTISELRRASGQPDDASKE